jgi:hypothetical protein
MMILHFFQEKMLKRLPKKHCSEENEVRNRNSKTEDLMKKSEVERNFKIELLK